jgi:nucleoside phosphorylase
MESGALGAVCYLLGNIPFVSIRKISDSADDVGVDDYKNSVQTDITAFSDIILKTLEKL